MGTQGLTKKVIISGLVFTGMNCAAASDSGHGIDDNLFQEYAKFLDRLDLK